MCWGAAEQAIATGVQGSPIVCIDQINDVYCLFRRMANYVTTSVDLMKTMIAPALGALVTRGV